MSEVACHKWKQVALAAALAVVNQARHVDPIGADQGRHVDPVENCFEDKSSIGVMIRSAAKCQRRELGFSV